MVDIKKGHTVYDIIVLGCGGTGSQFIPHLCQLASNISSKISSITFVDGDMFEEKNCNNQKCLLSEAGENKALALSSRFSYIYDNLNIVGYDEYLRDKNDLLNIIQKCRNDIILIGCVDNNSTRNLINDCFNEIGLNTNKEVIYIDSGNGDINRVGQVITGYYNSHGEKLLKSVVDIYPEIKNGDEDLSNINSCTREMSEHPQNISTNIFASTLIFSVLINILMFKKIEKNIIYFDVDKIEIKSR